MKVHFCCDMDGWVLQRQAERIAAHIDGATIGQSLRTDADATFYFPYYNLRQPWRGVNIPLFTHYEIDGSKTSQNKRDAWFIAREIADVCVAMSEAALPHLPKSTKVVELVADPMFVREPVFGVVGREYSSGRKRNDWVRDLPGKWMFTNGEVPWEKMPEFYAACDYIVVASVNEGGPMPVKEAIACGKPVIAPNVGWAWKYPVIRYEGEDGLRRTILSLVPKDETRDVARRLYSIAHYAAHKEAA